MVRMAVQISGGRWIVYYLALELLLFGKNKTRLLMLK